MQKLLIKIVAADPNKLKKDKSEALPWNECY
jgi:hypothetical protein